MYESLILLHLVAVVALLSNVVAAFFWQARATRTREPTVVAYAFRTLNAGDLWITPLASVLVLASGVGLALVTGLSILRTGWILWSTLAFLGSGLIFALGALPHQRRIAAWTTQAAAESGFPWERYQEEARRWATAAHWSLGLLLLAMALMVVRPSLPAFG